MKSSNPRLQPRKREPLRKKHENQSESHIVNELQDKEPNRKRKKSAAAAEQKSVIAAVSGNMDILVYRIRHFSNLLDLDTRDLGA